MGFLVFIARNPEVSRRLGMVSMKADMLAYSSADLPSYLRLFGQLLASGGFFFFVIVIAWVFGREFSDGTVKDLLAVPIPRGAILFAKFWVAFLWALGLSIIIVLFGLLIAFLLGLPGFNMTTILASLLRIGISTLLIITSVFPFGFFASIGRGYLLPLGVAILLLIAANLLAVIGLGNYFPWAIPGLFAQGDTQLPFVSYVIVIGTGIAGIGATYLWWKNADQNH
jgi:ABC-2 type transport system permease protein